MIEPSDELIVDTAYTKGAKIHYNPEAGTHYMLDNMGLPDFSYGIFSSEVAAARAYCEHHGILPKAPDVLAPHASMRITEAAPQQGLTSLFRFEIITITTLVVALTATIVFVAKYLF